MSSPLEADHLRARSIIRERLAPMLAQLDADPTLASPLLAGYDRIIVIHSRIHPLFNPSAFSRWLTIEKAYESKETKVWICHSNFSSPVNSH